MPNTFSRHPNLINWQLFLVAFFSFSWWSTQSYFSYFPGQSDKFAVLTVISLIASLVILQKLYNKLAFHLWAIYVWLLLAHYLQFYVIVSWLTRNKRMLGLFTTFLKNWVNDYYSIPLVLDFYVVSTACLVSFALTIHLIDLRKYDSQKGYKIFQQSKFSVDKLALYLNSSKIKEILLFTTIIGFVSLYLQSALGINGKDVVSELPFRLAGIIYNTSRLFIPISYIFLTYISSIRKNFYLSDFTAFIFVIYSFCLMVITNSRSSLPLALVLLTFVWVTTNSLNTAKISIIIVFIFILPILIFIPTSLRNMREFGEVGSFSNIVPIVESFIEQRNTLTRLAVARPITAIERAIYYPLIRLNGVVTFFPIVKSNLFSLETNLILQRWSELGYSTDLLFKYDILRINPNIRIGISTGVTGGFYLLSSGSAFFVSLIFSLWTLLWDYVYKYVIRKSVYITPVKLMLVGTYAFLSLISGNIPNFISYTFFLMIVFWLIDIAIDSVIKTSKSY